MMFYRPSVAKSVIIDGEGVGLSHCNSMHTGN